MLIKILFAGDGGQGTQTLADILCQVAFVNKLFVSFIPNYGLEKRGGSSLAFVTIGEKKISQAKFSKPDIIVISSDKARERVKQYERDDIKILDIGYYNEILEREKIEVRNFGVFLFGVLVTWMIKNKIGGLEQYTKLLSESFFTKTGWSKIQAAFAIGIAVGEKIIL